MLGLYDLPRPELLSLIAGWGWSPIHAARLWRYLYVDLAESSDCPDDLPRGLVGDLCSRGLWPPQRLKVCEELASDDQLTRKYLIQLRDGLRIETVAMQFRGRTTACLSSQIGCGLGCVFCATGQQGFTRNLTAGEIVAQAVHVACAAPQRLRNVVVMGMGEPLQNYNAVMQALDILRDPAGLAIGHKQVTISTVGIVPGIYRLADEGRPYSLAVSLHAATQEERLAMLPVAKAWPLEELIVACRYYTTKTQRKVFFEWTLIDGLNDGEEQARTLGHLLQGMPAHVNLIPLNPTEGFAGSSTQRPAAQQFQAVLREFGLPSTIRQRRGIDIAAGCGQLAGDVR